MSKWPVVKLGEVLARSDEIAKPQATTEYNEITVRLWGKGVVERGRVWGNAVSGRRFVARTGQFIASRIDARNGAMGLVPASLDGALVTNDFPLFNLNTGRIEPAFFAWLTKTADFVELCLRASEGTTNRVRLKEERFLNLEIPLPPLAEQRRIVARIEELAEQINEARELRKLANEEAQTFSSAAAEAVFYDLSQRIGTTPLGYVCKSITDGDHNTPKFSEAGIPFVFVGNVSSGYLHFKNAKRVSKQYFESIKDTRIPKRDDILYSAVGATLGIPTVVDTEEPFCFQRHIAILKPNHSIIDSRFMWYMLCSQTVFAKAWASTTGSAQPTIPLRAIRELPIPVPLLSEQHRIVAKLDALQAQVDPLKRLQTETADELDALLPAVLDRAFKGEKCFPNFGQVSIY